MERTSGFRATVALLLLVTFAAGAAAGVAADRLNLLPGSVRAEAEIRAPSPDDRDDDRRPRTTIEKFADELGLTANQRAEIEEILERFRASMDRLRDEVDPRFRALVDSVRGEIESVLTEEQVTEYRALLERRYERGREGRERDGRRNGSGGEGGERSR